MAHRTEAAKDMRASGPRSQGLTTKAEEKVRPGGSPPLVVVRMIRTAKRARRPGVAAHLHGQRPA